MMYFSTFHRSDGALFDLISSFRNPTSGLNDFAGPAFERFGSLTGAVNNQLYAGANTVSAMLDGYKHLEKNNPESPLVKAVTTFETIFTETPNSQSLPSGPDPVNYQTRELPPSKFDPVDAFMGDGKESINLNELITAVGGGQSGGMRLGGGIMSGLLGNQGAQSVMTTGSNAVFGLMRQMQNQLGPQSQSDGRILPASVALAQEAVSKTAGLANQSNEVDPIAPINASQPLPQLTSNLAQNFNAQFNSNSIDAIPKSPLGGLLSNVTKGLSSQTGNGNLMAKGMEMFALAQAVNSGDTATMASSMTNLLSGASSVLEKLSNNKGGVPSDTEETVDIEKPDPDWHQQNDLMRKKILDQAIENASSGDRTDLDYVDLVNDKLTMNRGKDVQALPSWMLNLDGAYETSLRRLNQKDSCFLEDQNLVGDQLTNLRSWDIENCQLLCQTTEGCEFWSFVPQIALCYMYSSVTGTIHTKHVVSGPSKCPEMTDATVPENPDANQFLFGLASPVQKFLGTKGSTGELTSLQRLMTGANGENIVSSALNVGGSPAGSSTYHLLGSRFADGFETGGKSIFETVPNLVGGIFRSPEDFQKAIRKVPETNVVETSDRALQQGSENLFLQRNKPAQGIESSSVGGDVSNTTPTIKRLPAGTVKIDSNSQPITTGQAVAPSTNTISGSSSTVDIFDTSSSLVRASSKFMDTVPLMDIAKAGYQLYNSGFFKKNGIFGGNSTGDKLTSLPPLSLGLPRVTCTWHGMQCCVPKGAVPKKHKNETISLNGVEADRCQAIDYFESEIDELCVTVRFETSASSCNTTKYFMAGKTVYQATMEMPGKMNDGLCECILDENEGMIDSNADWQVNIVSMRENKEKELAAEESAEKLKRSASTAMSWTRMISDTAMNVGNAAFGYGDRSEPKSKVPEGNVPYDGATMGENTRWSEALTNLTNIKEIVSNSRNAISSTRVNQ